MHANSKRLALALLAITALSQPAYSLEPGNQAIEQIEVSLDLAHIVRVPADTDMLVIGNPAIADAAVQPNGLLIITGKSYGRTNVMVLDAEGRKTREMMVRVTGQEPNELIVQRGMLRETYACAPRCEQTLTLGDGGEFFSNANAQAGTRNGAAQAPR